MDALQQASRITMADTPGLGEWKLVHVAPSARPDPSDVLGEEWTQEHERWLERCAWNEITADPRGVRHGYVDVAPATYCEVGATTELAGEFVRPATSFGTLPSSLPGSLGAHVVIMAESGRILVLRRSPSLMTHPGAVFAHLGESASYDQDGRLEDIARRCISEELGLTVDEVCRDLIGTCLETAGANLRAGFLARINLTERDILESQLAAADSWEATQAWFVDPLIVNDLPGMSPFNASERIFRAFSG